MRELLRKIRKILKDRRTRQIFSRFVMSIAAVVVFVTTYAMILPAITLEKTAVCGIEEHQHSDSCYEERLVCGQEESGGHHHEESCYSTVTELTCGMEEHRHSEDKGCYDADGNLICQRQDHVHSDSCYEEVRKLTCGQEEHEGHHHTDACFEKVLVCGKEVHTHSEKCYEEDGRTDAAADSSSSARPSDPEGKGDTGNTESEVSDSDAAAEEAQPGSYVPELDPLDMETMLDSHTDFYYFHAGEEEEIPADSAEITDWKKVGEETVLAPPDLVRMYLAYTIPAGSLNETNLSARYRLPDKLHLSDQQIDAMNQYENGIAVGFRDYDAVSDSDEREEEKENYQRYLGAEAVEGDRRPDEQLKDGAQEFISAVVRAENVYDNNGDYLGQDLIFTFVPYSIEKNQNTYDADQTLISAGEKITGWFACDFRLDQIDWEPENDINKEDVDKEEINKEGGRALRESARVIFVPEDQEKDIPEISRVLRMISEIEEADEIEGTGESREIPENGENGEIRDGASSGKKKGSHISTHVITADGEDYLIKVTCGTESGIPDDADLAVEEISKTSSVYDKYVSKTESALGIEEGTAGYIRLFDISIVNKVDHSIKYQPEAGTTVDVCIELEDKDSSLEAATSTQVVHFADDTEDGDIIESSTEGQTISFETDGFSIYAIVDSNKRLQYNFYDGTSLLASEYIKKQDNLLQELYDPGVEPEYGQTFAGWAYSPDETNPSNIYTIEQLNQQAADKYNSAAEELTEINVYAIYDEAWYLRYMDQDSEGNATVLNVVRVRKDADDKNVPIDYTFTPEEGIVFEGWTDVATGQTYQQGDTITLDHHVDLYVKLQGRNWLVFDSNAGGPGSGVTYTPPQLLIGSEATTTKPEDPARRGYTFTGWNTKADGTGTWWYRTNGSVNRFGNTLSADTTLYAQWEANDTDYHVVFWMQKATDAAGLADGAKEYDYVSSERRTAKTGTTVSTTTADRQKGGTANREYGYYFTYNENNSDTTATVDANGTTVLNVYYDRREITYNFSSSTDFTVPSYTGVVDGETVTLTPDGNGGYTYQKTVTETTNLPYTGTRYNTTTVRNNNNPQHYGVVAGRANPVALDRRDSNRWYYDGSYYSWGTQYYGTHYIVSSSGSYGWVDGDMVALNADGTYTTTVTTTTTEPYTGEVTASTTQTRSASFTGLYGSTFSNWPDLGNGRVWTVTIGSGWNAQTLSLPMALTLFDPQAALTPTATQTTVNFTASNYSTGYTMTVYTQTTDGEWVYSDDNVLTTANLGERGTWYPTETFEGFTVNSYQTGRTINPNGTWTPVTSSGSFTYNNNVFLRYSRNQHKIHFISQGEHVTGRTEQIVDGVYYDSDLSKYAVGGSDYYEPTNGNEGYYFAGWYTDPDCQIPYDFNTTMPDSDITVYAKWDTYRVRVVLVPTVNNEHNDEVEFANNQSLSFRMDYNEEVSDTNICSSVAKRAGYKLIGWYYTPDFDPSTEIHFPFIVNKDAPGVDMNYQSGEDWNKYGDNDGSHDNVRGILKLYAKWELDVDENSAYVEYVVDDVYRTYDTAGMLQTTIPVDDDKYALTNNSVTFQVAEAPTEYTSGFEFYRWVLLNPDGSESDIQYNPSDMASEIPSSFIYEETITDDLGNTATIKKIRLKAKFNIETEKVTTVTFDGNGGVTNDSAEQESVTESYPINKDFFMKDEDSFVREGYTLLGWAFEREDGSKITPEEFKQAIAEMSADQLIQKGIYRLGQKVAADNLTVSDENNWNPLENTVYAVWEINTYTVTVKKVVDGETAADKEFSFAASAGGDYSIPDGDTGFQLVNGGEKTFTEVPYGTVLTFTETPASGYSIQSVDAKQTTRPDKTPLEEADYIDLGGADDNPYTIKGDTVITYTNEKAKEQKLRIHKIGDDAASGLAGAKFNLTAAPGTDGFDKLTGITSLDGTSVPADLGYLLGNDSADTTLFLLPVGTYTLSETDAPDYYDGLSGDVTLTVTSEGITMSKGDDSDDVELSEPDQGVYTLTVSNIRKLGTVTVIKNVVGTDADKEKTYSFTQTGLTGEATFDLRGSDNQTTEGILENQTVFENVPFGTVFSITEANTYTDFDTTIMISNEDLAVTTTRLATGNVTVDSEVVTITYTNTRNNQPIKVFKYETGTTPEHPLANAVFSLTGPEGSGISYTGLTTNADGYLVNGEGILFKLPVNNGAYMLTETQAPAGYQIIGEGKTTFTVAAASVTGAIAETQTVGEAEVPTGVYVIKVQNSAGVELPYTGGPGTTLIYLMGIMLTGLAGAGLVMRLRRNDTT